MTFPTLVWTDAGWQPRDAGGGSTVSGFLVFRVLDSNFLVPVSNEDAAVFMRGLTADRTVTLPAGPGTGQIVVIKDEDGSLSSHNIVIAGGANTIDGAASYVMTLVQNGNKGSVSLMFTGAGWAVV